MGKIKTVNSLSGGKTSSYMAVHYPADYEIFSLVCIDDPLCTPKDKGLIQYVNDKLGNEYISQYGEFIATAEDDATLVVMRDMEQYLGREIKWVRGPSFDQIIDDPANGFLPSWARRYCTTQLKIIPIFKWCFIHTGLPVKMRIGFRNDPVEYARAERFFNSDPGWIEIPVSCSVVGSKRQKHEEIKWRYVEMPLIRNGVTSLKIESYWDRNGYIGQDTLFEKRRQIVFPTINNCVICHHKDGPTLCASAALHPYKMGWGARQEDKGKGTWKDDKITYRILIDQSKSFSNPEIAIRAVSCDSGECGL